MVDHDDVADDYLGVVAELDDALPSSRRVRRNQAILNYVLDLHELVIHALWEDTGPRKDDLAMACLSKTTARHLPRALQALEKSIGSERQPYAIANLDGDDLEDEFTSAVKEAIAVFRREITSAETSEKGSVIATCALEVHDEIEREFERQSQNSWI